LSKKAANESDFTRKEILPGTFALQVHA